MAELITESELCEWRKNGIPYIGERKNIHNNKEQVEQWLSEKAKKNK